jgi:hypothetical protein
MTTVRWAMLLSAFTLVGCSGQSSGDKAAPKADDRPAMSGSDTGMMKMDGMDSGGMGMGDVHHGMQGMGMMSMMQAHMDSMQHMSPQQIQAMMAMHQDMMSRMMDAMGTDMKGMHMEPDAGWSALSDSVRQDLAELPALSGKALENRVRGHVDRVRRLMARHEKMMGK